MRLASQLDAPMVDTADANEAHRDAYAHSAGLALGLVYLGRARRTSMSSSADSAPTYMMFFSSCRCRVSA